MLHNWALRTATAVTERTARWAAFLATISLILIVIVTSADAIARYIFSAPIYGAQAIIEGLLQPAVIFLGAALVGRMDGHMKVDLITFSNAPRIRKARDLFFSLLITTFWAACAWQAGLRAYEAYVLKQWPVGEIAAPALIAYGLTAIGCLLAALAHLVPPRRDSGDTLQ